MNAQVRLSEAFNALLGLEPAVEAASEYVLAQFTDEDGYVTTCAVEIVPDEAPCERPLR